MSAALTTTGIELTKYSPLKAEIEALKLQNAVLVFQYDKPADNKNARSHIFKMRQKKADVERVRKDLKADALEFGRKVDAVAKELTGELEAMINVHQKPIDEIEQREAAARQAEADRIERERLEAERVAREEQEAILAAERAEAKRVANELAEMKRQQEIERIKREAADKARLDAEARAKAEKEAGERREREARAAQERAERERQEAAIAHEREKLAAEARRIEAEKRAIREAEEAKARAVAEQAQAVQRAKDEAERKAREVEEGRVRKVAEQRAAEEKRLKRKAFRKAVVDEIAESITSQASGIGNEEAQILAGLMLDGKIARVSVSAAEPHGVLQPQ